MKKVVFVVAMIGFLVTTSCLKQRNCKCTETDGDFYNYTVVGSKSGATAACESYEDSDQTCELTKN